MEINQKINFDVRCFAGTVSMSSHSYLTVWSLNIWQFVSNSFTKQKCLNLAVGKNWFPFFFQVTQIVLSVFQITCVTVFLASGLSRVPVEVPCFICSILVRTEGLWHTFCLYLASNMCFINYFTMISFYFLIMYLCKNSASLCSPLVDNTD